MTDIQPSIPPGFEPPPPDACSPSEDQPPGGADPSLRRDDPQIRLLRESAKDKKADRRLRREYADKAHTIVVKSLIAWVVIISWAGLSNMLGKPAFSDTALIAITSATTLNVFAAFLCVVRGLFPNGKREESPERSDKG